MTVGIKRQSLSVVPILYEEYNERLRSMDSVGGDVQIRIKREAVRFLSNMCSKRPPQRLFERDPARFVKRGGGNPARKRHGGFRPGPVRRAGGVKVSNSRP